MKHSVNLCLWLCLLTTGCGDSKNESVDPPVVDSKTEGEKSDPKADSTYEFWTKLQRIVHQQESQVTTLMDSLPNLFNQDEPFKSSDEMSAKLSRVVNTYRDSIGKLRALETANVDQEAIAFQEKYIGSQETVAEAWKKVADSVSRFDLQEFQKVRAELRDVLKGDTDLWLTYLDVTSSLEKKYPPREFYVEED